MISGELEVGSVADALLEKPYSKPNPPSLPLDEIVEVNQIDQQWIDLQEARQESSSMISVDYDAPARLAFAKTGSSVDFDTFKSQYLKDTSEMVAEKFRDATIAEREEKERAAREADEARAKVESEEKAKAEEEARLAERAAKAEAERVEQERLAAEKAESERIEQERLAAEKAESERVEQERLAAEMAEAERVEQERLALEKERLEEEKRAREEEEALSRIEAQRVAEEHRLAEQRAAEEEQRLLEEQAAAAREAVRLMELDDDDEDDFDEDDELSDEDYESSALLAQELLGVSPAIGGDLMDELNDDFLQAEMNGLTEEEEDALGKAAREA